jgi:hypothetical protein
MRREDAPHSVYLYRLALEDDAGVVRHEGDATAAWGKIENPERH